MNRTFRTVATIVLAPPLFIYPLAHARILLSDTPASLSGSILVAIWGIGIAALLTSGWRRILIGLAAAAYTVLALLLFPLLALSASCTVGPCL